jgi:hypothetical protein
MYFQYLTSQSRYNVSYFKTFLLPNMASASGTPFCGLKARLLLWGMADTLQLDNFDYR